MKEVFPPRHGQMCNVSHHCLTSRISGLLLVLYNCISLVLQPQLRTHSKLPHKLSHSSLQLSSLMSFPTDSSGFKSCELGSLIFPIIRIAMLLLASISTKLSLEPSTDPKPWWWQSSLYKFSFCQVPSVTWAVCFLLPKRSCPILQLSFRVTYTEKASLVPGIMTRNRSPSIMVDLFFSIINPYSISIFLLNLFIKILICEIATTYSLLNISRILITDKVEKSPNHIKLEFHHILHLPFISGAW